MDEGGKTETQQFYATFILIIHLLAARRALQSHLDWENISSSTVMTKRGFFDAEEEEPLTETPCSKN